MRERLEDVMRHGEVAENLVLLLRGGAHYESVERTSDWFKSVC